MDATGLQSSISISAVSVGIDGKMRPCLIAVPKEFHGPDGEQRALESRSQDDAGATDAEDATEGAGRSSPGL